MVTLPLRRDGKSNNAVKRQLNKSKILIPCSLFVPAEGIS